MVKVYCSTCSNRCVGDVLKVGSNYFHQKCFKCKDCHKKLDTGGFFCRNDNYYCKEDYTNRFSNVCFICKLPINSEVVSALNHHFHKDCFRCNCCSKTFAPGDRVIMKNDQFLCEHCHQQLKKKIHPCDDSGVISSASATSSSCKKHPQKNLPTELPILSSSQQILKESNRTNNSRVDDTTTDQGYFSGDPLSVSSPLQNEDNFKKSTAQSNAKPSFQHKSASRPSSRSQARNGRWRSSRSLFEFGQFLNISYLKLKERHDTSQQQRSATSQSRPRSTSSQNQKSLLSSSETKSKLKPPKPNGMVSLLSMPLTAVAAGCKEPRSPYLREQTTLQRQNHGTSLSQSKQEALDRHEVCALAAYPNGSPPREPYPLERDDWPAPLYSALILRDKWLLQKLKQSSRGDGEDDGNNSTIDCTQSLDQLSPRLMNGRSNTDNFSTRGGSTTRVKMGQIHDLIEVLYGPNQSYCRNANNDEVISISRSPSANIEPNTKLRYVNHSDKSNSRNLQYLNDPNRHKGLSVDYISSTSRPFLAGTLDNHRVLCSIQQTAHELRLASLIEKLQAHKHSGVLSTAESSTAESSAHHHQNQHNNSSTGGGQRDGLHTYIHVDPGLSWNATRTLSDSFDVQLKTASEYDSTIEETLFENIGEEEMEVPQPSDEMSHLHGSSSNNNRGGVRIGLGSGGGGVDAVHRAHIPATDRCSSMSHIDVTTGLVHLPYNKHCNYPHMTRVLSRDPANRADDRSSINSRLDSLENWSFWSQKQPINISHRSFTYTELVLKEPKLMKTLDPHKLESYLSTEEFQLIFGLNRSDFYRLPEWKRNDLKRRVDLF